MISCKGKTVSAPGVSLHVDMTAHLSSYHRVSCVDAESLLFTVYSAMNLLQNAKSFHSLF